MLVLKSVKTKLLALYGDNQFGFRPSSSTLDAHLAIHDSVTRDLDITDIEGVAMIALDLSKAFDRLSHESLIHTLSKPTAGLPSTFLQWIQDFLSDRSQRVSFQGAMSTSITKVTSGVPQGSILAPYLFASHMGSLAALSSTTKIIKYADDVTLLIPYNKNNDVSLIIADEIQNVRSWCKGHGLTLNEKKTKTLLFSKMTPSLQFTQCCQNINSEIKVLGVTFETSLKWNKHVADITKKASRRICALKSLKRIPTVSRADLYQVYCNYILGILEYNSPLFLGISSKNNEKMERIRRRCHRIICGIECQCNKFPSVRVRREDQAMKVFKRMMNSTNISHSLLPKRLPRTRHFQIEPMKTARRAKSFVPACAMKWNSFLSRTTNTT